MDAIVAQVDALTTEIQRGVYALALLSVLDVAYHMLAATKRATAFFRPAIAVFVASIAPGLVQYLAR